MTPSGASTDEWSHFDVFLGLTADLLPVVCTPNLPISPNSTLKSYGKVPSVLTSSGHVAGLAKWTGRIASDADIASWSRNPHYGICLQTRRVRAIDVDIEDAGLADLVRRTILGWDPSIVWPMRWRDNSHKFLLLFELEGTYGKSRLDTGRGLIEFLADGQQCLVAGCHPSGVAYQWRTERGADDSYRRRDDQGTLQCDRSLPQRRLPHHIPSLSPSRWDDLRELLEFVLAPTGETWTESRRTTPRQSLEVLDIRQVTADPVVAHLQQTGAVRHIMSDGRVHVTCPWDAQHTTASDDSASTWFPAGTGGYERGHYLCLHAHCADRTDQEYLDAVGYTDAGLGNLDEEPEEIKQAFALERIEDGKRRGASPVEGPRFDRNAHGHIIWSAWNVEQALRHPGIGGFLVNYDRFLDRVIVAERIDDSRYHPPRPLDDDDAIRFIIHATRRGFKKETNPFDMVNRAFRKVARDQATDSAINWLTGLPEWDQVRRVDTFCSAYLGAEDTPYTRSVSRYWWTAHAGRVLDPGCQADAAVVLLSHQGTGKTSAVKAIVPYNEWFCELSFEAHDKDLSRAMRGKLIGEIAELRGLNSRDKESLKAWISRRYEAWTEKFERYEGMFPRRLVLVGTTNNDDLFSDETGHRRWLPVTVGRKQHVDRIVRDRAQLWAEAAVMFRQAGGVVWQEAQQLAVHEHVSFESEELHDAWEEAIVAWLRSEGLGGGRPADEESLTIGRVLEDALRIDTNRIQIRDQRRAGRILRKLGYEKVVMRDGERVLKVWKKGVKGV